MDALAPLDGMVDGSKSSSDSADRSMGYCSDEEDRPRPMINMSIFKDALKSSESLVKPSVPPVAKNIGGPMLGLSTSNELEMYSGLRIRNRCLSREALSAKLMEVRFVKLQALRHAVLGDGVRGSWATIGAVVGKGQPKVSSNSNNYSIWKLSCLNEHTVSLFLFGDAYKEHWKESAGCIIAVFDAKVRQDEARGDFSLSISNVNQLMVVGTSVDFAICNGKRKDGAPCTVTINKREGQYCRFHAAAARKNTRSKRPELSGGNLATGLTGPFRNHNQSSLKHAAEASPEQPLKRAKHRSAIELSKMLSNGDKMTTRTSSQGLRFLASMTENSVPVNKELFGDKKQKLERPSDKTSDAKQAQTPSCKPSKKKDQTPVYKAPRPPLQELPNSNKKKKIIELDIEIEDDADDTMAQAMSIFRS